MAGDPAAPNAPNDLPQLPAFGSEDWRRDLSDVILPLPVYDTSSDEGGSEDDTVGSPSDKQLVPRKQPEPWEEVPPQRVLQLMRENEKHGHTLRDLHARPRPAAADLVPTVRHLTEDEARCQLHALVGGQTVDDPGEPAIIDGLAAGWRAEERWKSAEAFVMHYGDMPLKVHEMVSVSGMGKGTELWLPARQFVDYALGAQVDAPFYVFQKKFIAGQHDALFEDYSRPALFADDVWDMTPKLRACFSQNKFFCIGGERTGSTLHQDPHFTAAWNTLLCGEKRWVLFPPGTAAEEIGVPGDLHAQLKTPCSYWWHDWYPKLAAPDGPGSRLGMREVIQRAGETIFVPAGWWHAVLNYGWTIAVTENSCPSSSLARVWPQLRACDPIRARRLRRALRTKRPELLEVVAASQDGPGSDGESTSGVEDGAAADAGFRMW